MGASRRKPAIHSLRPARERHGLSPPYQPWRTRYEGQIPANRIDVRLAVPINHVTSTVNPQGCRVTCFKKPTAEEAGHDFLWRIHPAAPARGEIAIFNRSHYEDVLVVRVHDLAPEQVWRKRYDQINAFERLLVEEGTTILKFFLHIDKKEQKERLLDRLAEEEKHWKFNPGDLKERALWQDYMRAYEDVLNKTTTQWAPWTNTPHASISVVLGSVV